ncbi:MAG: thioredoxin family protein [Rhizomicrobium sp.]|jgi:thiol:disulfide interchange protein
MIPGKALTLATALVAVAAMPSFAATAPRITSISSIDQLWVPDRPFDESSDADAAVDAAFARARAEHKLVLINLGANWCADCRILAGVMALRDLKPFVEQHYVVVDVDVGRINRNLQIPARFGIKERPEAVPCILVVDPDGTLVDRDHIEALEDMRSMTPQAVADWLAQWPD